MSHKPDAPTHPATAAALRLREAMKQRCVALPGAFNGLMGRAVADAGFEGTYISGAAVSASAGLPDVGLVSLEHFCRVIQEVARASGLPLIADADTGFGEGEMVTRAVWDYHAAGAAGFHIEDQVFPKRCGHLDGKSLVAVNHMADKVRRAADARDACSRGAFIVCARTDAAGVDGLDAAIERAKAYIDAGADMIFPEGLNSEADFAKVAQALRPTGALLLANMTEFGKTPVLPLNRFADMGYHCVIHPVSTLRSAMGEAQRMLAALKRDGDVSASLEGMQDRAELYRLLSYTPGQEWVFPGPRLGQGR
jgi:methylisocitrate lyase